MGAVVLTNICAITVLEYRKLQYVERQTCIAAYGTQAFLPLSIANLLQAKR
jgi:hypothetical protein